MTKKITQFTQISSIDDADILPIVDMSEVTTKKVTALQIKNYALSGSGMAIGNGITSSTEGSVLFAGTGGILAQDNANLFWDDLNNRLGLLTNTPTATLSVGPASEFRVNATGNITRINNVPTSFPASQGAASTLLSNDGAGNLSWVAATSETVITGQTTTGLADGDFGYVSAANTWSKSQNDGTSTQATVISCNEGTAGRMALPGSVIENAKFTTAGGSPAVGATVWLAAAADDAGTGAGKLTATAPTGSGSYLVACGVCVDAANYAGSKTAKIIFSPAVPVLISQADPTLDELILATANIEHYWPLNEAAGASTVADLVGGADLTTYNSQGTIAFEGYTLPNGDKMTEWNYASPNYSTAGDFFAGTGVVLPSGDRTWFFAARFDPEAWANYNMYPIRAYVPNVAHGESIDIGWQTNPTNDYATIYAPNNGGGGQRNYTALNIDGYDGTPVLIAFRVSISGTSTLWINGNSYNMTTSGSMSGVGDSQVLFIGADYASVSETTHPFTCQLYRWAGALGKVGVVSRVMTDGELEAIAEAAGIL